jgi:ABC-2 type transport system ATP-binding protein
MTNIVASGTSGSAVEIEELVKSFGSTRAVDRLSLTVPTGTVYGLLGPNGAGKTTVIRMLGTLLRPDSGTARVFGRDVVRDADAVRSKIALTGQFASVDDDLTGRENLTVLARLLGHRHRQARTRADELLDVFDLGDAAARLVRTYSGGMRRRLDIAASVIVTPELLFLDEPTTGLDPRSRNQVWETVLDLVSAGTTVLLTTQYLEEADRLAKRIAVIDHGRVVAEGTSGELKASLGQRILRVRVSDPELSVEGQLALSRALDAPVELAREPGSLSVRLPAGQSPRDEAEQVAAALTELSSAGITVSEIALEQPSLDEVFLSLTGSTGRSGKHAKVHST